MEKPHLKIELFGLSEISPKRVEKALEYFVSV
jgi:hypothetical protein